MNKFIIVTACLWLVTLSVGIPQEIKRLVPWSQVPEGSKMGMAAQDLRTVIPKLSPLSGVSDTNGPGQADMIKDGMYVLDSEKTDYSETTLYGIGGGRLTQFYWSSKNMAALAAVQGLRKRLSQMHGDGKLGYKARVTKDGIAKITTEIFTVKNTKLVISLSSALGETEIAILDTSDPIVDINELYFSFEKQRERLRGELLRLTKQKPKDETDASCLDVLREVIAVQATVPSVAQSNQGSETKEKPYVNDPQVKTNEKEAARTEADNGSEWGSKYVILVLVSGFVFVGVLVAIRKTKRKKESRK